MAPNKIPPREGIIEPSKEGDELSTNNKMSAVVVILFLLMIIFALVGIIIRACL